MAEKVLALLFLFVGSLLALPCKELRLFSLIDCAGCDLEYIPHFELPKVWVKSLSLRRNNINAVNFSTLAIDFPNLKLIDLRENPFNCASTKLFKVLSDCFKTSAAVRLTSNIATTCKSCSTEMTSSDSSSFQIYSWISCNIAMLLCKLSAWTCM